MIGQSTGHKALGQRIEASTLFNAFIYCIKAMTTRQRAQRGDELKEFEGRVRKWRKEWQPAGDTVKTKNLKFYKWIPTGVCNMSNCRAD
jgi:hypothetical protein